MNPPAVPRAPRWLADILRLLPVRAQFVLSGNVRDHVLASVGGHATLVPLLRSLWEGLRDAGFEFIAVYDPVDGVRAYPAEAAPRAAAARLLQLPEGGGPSPLGLEALAELARKVVSLREARCALVIDDASRLVRAAGALDAGEHRFFAAMEKLALQAAPMSPPGRAAGPVPLFNPVVWVANREQDLPAWFVLDADRIESIACALPDYETRAAAAALLAPLFHDGTSAGPLERDAFCRAFADGTDGIRLAGMADIAQLGAAAGHGLERVDDAIRAYKLGLSDNPWRKAYLRDKVRAARAEVERRVLGQPQAVVKTLDILMRSVTGLTGAQARSAPGRPRGILFFAGPTGVGKTELAKALTEIVFGDERAMIRFDMSEFAAEHSSARLLGAPPGYVGYDAGGELTNAVRQRPFSVILFDEIEKAHPRILDKFLQILEDGRLTDGRGQTAWFSESLIVFTSNLGIYAEDAQGARIQRVKPGDPYAEVEATLRAAVADHFKYRLMRPELLNRIGDNIVVFDFIRADPARRIFDGMLANVLKRVSDEHGVRVLVDPAATERLRELCTEDLSQGGRGIGNRLESVFINPLARALFARDPGSGAPLAVAGVNEENRIWTLTLRSA